MVDRADNFRQSRLETYKGTVNTPLGTPKMDDQSLGGEQVRVKMNFTMGPANYVRHAKKLPSSWPGGKK